MIDLARMPRRRSLAIPGVAGTHVAAAESAERPTGGSRPGNPGDPPDVAGGRSHRKVLHRNDLMFTPASSGPQLKDAGHLVWLPPGRAQCAQPLQPVFGLPMVADLS
jgi:hypothetical protein